MLSQFLVSEIFTFMLIFCRVGSAMVIMPGFGEAYVLTRARLFLSLMISLVLVPVITPFPTLPANVGPLVIMILAEVLVGLFIGTVARLMIAALSTASMIISFQSGLASAITQDITVTQGQSTSLGNLIGIAALLVIFTSDMHHVLLRAVVESYQLFPAGMIPSTTDMSAQIVKTINDSFLVSLQLASPFVVIGLIIYLAGGIIARLMPSFQVFFILAAPQLLISFFILMITFGTILLWYMEYFKSSMMFFIPN